MYNTKAFFNERANSWDKKAIYDDTSIQMLLRLCDIKPAAKILDIGCGTGVLEPYLLQYSPAKIWAVDFAEQMIAVANGKISHPAVQFICADIFDVHDISCDLCIMLSTFPHFEDPKQLVNHLHCLVKVGGRLSISHSQGKKSLGSCGISHTLPAQGLINLLRPFFRLDVIIDNDVMFLISGVKF